MNAWIQKHDFSSGELGTVSKREAIEALNGFDWDSELQKEAKAIELGHEACSPGMGLIADDGTILHIVPSKEGHLIHHHWKQQTMILGLFRKSRSVNTSGIGISHQLTEEIFQSHFRSAHERTRELILEG